MELSVDFDSSWNPGCELFVSDPRLFVTGLQTCTRRTRERDERKGVFALPTGHGLNWDDGWSVWPRVCRIESFRLG